MKPNPQQVESALHSASPAELDGDTLERLELACHDQLADLPPSLVAAESQLETLAPTALPDHLAARAETILSRISYEEHSKFISFTKATPAPSSPQPVPSKKPTLAIAAAVALCGAAIPFFINPPQDPSHTAATPQPSLATPATPSPHHSSRAAFAPAGFSTDVRNTNDLGVVWSDDRQPLRVVKVIYIDETKFLNDQGEEIIAEIPRIEYILVPEKID